MAVATLNRSGDWRDHKQPRYYEYISRLAPSGQQGTYMGFAFPAIGMGSLVGGCFGGSLIHRFGKFCISRNLSGGRYLEWGWRRPGYSGFMTVWYGGTRAHEVNYCPKLLFGRQGMPSIRHCSLPFLR